MFCQRYQFCASNILCMFNLSSGLFVFQFPFFTLVAFDQHQIGLPVAWCIQQSKSAKSIGKFLMAVKQRAIAVQPNWQPSCFIIDCAEVEVVAIQEVFPNIPIYFCSWHVRWYVYLQCNACVLPDLVFC